MSSSSSSSSLHSTAVLLSTPGIQSKLFRPVYPRSRTLAVIAHPWARLGGTWSDPVVQNLLRVFLSLSIPTAIYNGRGAGQTTLRPSWTGRGEIEDYGRVVEAARRVAWDEEGQVGPEGGEMFLCGYSYGALIALAQGPVEGVKTLFVGVSPPSSFAPFFFPFFTFPGLPSPNHDRKPHRPSLLLLIGDQDAFSLDRKAIEWTKGLQSEGDRHSVLSATSYGVDHFWRKKGALRQMRNTLKTWVEGDDGEREDGDMEEEKDEQEDASG